jgi:hypothetical protein
MAEYVTWGPAAIIEELALAVFTYWLVKYYAVKGTAKLYIFSVHVSWCVPFSCAASTATTSDAVRVPPCRAVAVLARCGGVWQVVWFRHYPAAADRHRAVV